MGVLNVTPDSFSDGGAHLDPVAAGLAMAAEGADIIDIGGESTRPGALSVPPDAEQARILPVIRGLADAGICVSIDTRNASTMRAALRAGAAIINDVSGLTHDPDAAAVVAEHGCPVVLMHMRGTPATMNALAVYRDVVQEVKAEFATRLQAARVAGIRPEQIILDPGIGFAKLAPQTVTLLRGLPELATLGYPLLVGVSRKSFIGRLADEMDAQRRLGGSLAAGLYAVEQGASILRVHDVFATVQGLRVWHALSG
jgi:dihydropteroate synthase